MKAQLGKPKKRGLLADILNGDTGSYHATSNGSVRDILNELDALYDPRAFCVNDSVSLGESSLSAVSTSLGSIFRGFRLLFQLSECQCSVSNSENSNQDKKIVREDSGLIPAVLAAFFVGIAIERWAAYLLFGNKRRSGVTLPSECVSLSPAGLRRYSSSS